MTAGTRPRTPNIQTDAARGLAIGALLLVAGAVASSLTHTTIAAVVFLAGVATIAVAIPRATLIAIIVLFPVHPLAMRVVNVDLGLGGVALVLISAWKEVALGAILLVLVGRLILGMRSDQRSVRFRPHPFDLLAILLVALVLGMLVSQHTVPALNASRLLLFPVGVYAATRLGGLDPSRDLPLAVVGAACVATFGIFQGSALGWDFVGTYWGLADQPIPYTFTAQFLVGPRSAGTLSSPVEFATYLAMFVGVAVAIALVRPQHRRAALAALPILILALALTFSRSAIVAALLGSITVIVVARLKREVSSRVIALLVLVAIPALLISGFVYIERGGVDLIRSTIITMSGDAELRPGGADSPLSGPPAEGSTVDHITSLQEGMSLLRSHPFGVGLGNVGSRAVPGSDERPAYFAESWYLTMGLSLGWLGTLWAVAWTVGLAGLAMWVVGRRTGSDVGLSLIGVVATVAIVGLLLPTMMEPQIAVLPWALAGLAVVVGSGSVEPSSELTERVVG